MDGVVLRPQDQRGGDRGNGRDQQERHHDSDPEAPPSRARAGGCRGRGGGGGVRLRVGSSDGRGGPGVVGYSVRLRGGGVRQRRFRRGRRGVRREPGRQQELVRLFDRQAEQLGAAGDVLAVAGPSGQALLPPDEGRTAHGDPSRKLGVANPRPLHVGGQQLGESPQLLQLRHAKLTK